MSLKKKMMGFAPNSVFYKSPTSIWLQNKELTPIEKKKPQNWLPNQKTETLNNNNKKIQLKCHPWWL